MNICVVGYERDKCALWVTSRDSVCYLRLSCISVVLDEHRFGSKNCSAFHYAGMMDDENLLRSIFFMFLSLLRSATSHIYASYTAIDIDFLQPIHLSGVHCAVTPSTASNISSSDFSADWFIWKCCSEWITDLSCVLCSSDRHRMPQIFDVLEYVYSCIGIHARHLRISQFLGEITAATYNGRAGWLVLV